MSLFDDHSGTDVFADRDVLLDEHIPEELVARDDQIDRYLKALMPVYDGDSPDHVFLYGPNGSGKTAITRFILRELRESEEAEIDLSTIWLRCNGVGTDYMLAIKLANRILPEDEQLSRGHAEDEVYDRLFQALEREGGTVLIVLDEIDRIKNLDTFLYEVTRARSPGGRLDETKVGVIGISKESTFYDNLSSDTKSTLNSKTIDFPAYNALELREIVEKRIENAFTDHAVDDSVAPLVGGRAAKYSGDARFALDILREAGDMAKHQEDDVVTTSHADDATEEVLEDRVAKKLENLSDQAKRAVYALATLNAEGNETPRTTEVYDRYRELMSRANKDPVVSKQVTDYLNQFEQLGLTLITENRGSGGRYNQHELRYHLGDVVGGIEKEIEHLEVVTQEIQPYIGRKIVRDRDDPYAEETENDGDVAADGGEDECQ